VSRPPLLLPVSVRRHTLPNGLTLLVRRDTSAPVVAIVTYVKAGYFDETDDVTGIAHVLEHMYFKGTARRGVGEIAQETKAAGGYLNAGTIYDHTSYYTVLPSSGFLAGLDIQADAYANSVVNADELRRELEVIIQEAKRKEDNPAAVTVETLYELLHDRHRMRRWRIGREDALRNLTRDQLLSFYRGRYRPADTILVVVGDVDPDDVERHVERLYGPLSSAPVVREPGPREPEHGGFRYRELRGDIAQTQLAFGWRTPGTLHVDTPALEMAALVIGAGRASRLYRAVRERRLAASVSASDYTPTELGVFVVRAEGPPEHGHAAARAVWEQLRNIRESGVTDEELRRARRLTEARWIRQLESMEGQANYLAEWEALGDWTLGDERLTRLLATTAAQIQDAAHRHLVPDQSALVSYLPRDAESLAPDAGHMMERLEQAPRPAALAPTTGCDARAPVEWPLDATLETETARVRVYRTARGVPILVRKSGSVPIAHIGVYALGGACDEPAALCGLTTLLTRVSLKGTRRRTAACIAEEAELLGGSIGAGAGGESFGWSMTVPSRHLASALELLADVTQHPSIHADALDTERAIALASLAQQRDDMYRHPMQLLRQAAFPEHPYGANVLGEDASLARIQPADVCEWQRARVIEGATALVIVGDVDPDAAARDAALYFDALEPGAAPDLASPRWPAAPVERAEERDKAQTALALAFPAPARYDDQRFAAALLAGVASGLGGRFFEQLRDRQSLAYTVSAFASARRNAGLFVTYIATSPAKEAIARRGLLDQIARLRDAPVTAEELARAKGYAIGTHAIRQQSGAAVVAEILDAWLFGSLSELEEYDESVRAVTAGEMQDVAARYFDEERVVEGIVRGVQEPGRTDRGSPWGR